MLKRVLIAKAGFPLINTSYIPGQEKDMGVKLGDFQFLIDSIMRKAAIGRKNEEVVGNNKITYEQIESILFLISSDSSEIGVIEIFLPELENLFFDVFPREFVANWQGPDASVFKAFEVKLDQLRSAFENRIMTKAGSRRMLDTLSVMELPQRIQKTAMTILDAKIASFEEIISLLKIPPQEAVAHIQEILNVGFLYTTKIGNRVYYSIKSFGDTTPTVIIPPTEVKVHPPTSAISMTAPSTQKTPVVSAKIPGMEIKKRSIDKGNMPFLIKQIPKNLDRVFDAILTRKVLLIILDPETDKNQVLLNMILDTLQCFAPEREFRLVTFTKDFIHPREADIIRISRELLQFYSNEIVLDLDNKKIMNGLSSMYLEGVIKDMGKMKQNECSSLLINRVALIEKIAQDWAKIRKLNLPQDEFLTNIRAKHTAAMIEIMERVATNVYGS